ncbi:uncharacterized protein LOC130654747 [Hydractinia symbiolongicarpus]|uniref:uncharacterized protein LOC130654747 n=1 Tax=Hydractinia symbiolongicarpus TaxID=13093 RepID=UPI00254A1885|nr:uncharacterized protein LOC130654747 [Hydractinia symbiolongicarpus]
MDKYFGFVFFMLTIAVIEMRSIEDSLLYKNVKIPKNWKTDDRYSFQWKGDFTYGVPEDSKCEKVMMPKYGRFICSSGKGLGRIMCLTECMDGYEHAKKAMVFICKDEGKWLDIRHKEISTPYPECIRSKWPSQ